MIKELTIIMTEACNASCSFCTQKHNTKNDMTIERLYEIIETFQKEHQDDYTIDLFGGETLMNFKIIQEYFEGFNDPRCKGIQLFTNGILLTPEIYDFCLKNRIKLVLSYDGTNTTQRGYTLPEKVFDIVKKDTEVNRIIKVSFSVFKNGLDIKKLYQELEQKFNLHWTQMDFYFNRNYSDWTQEDILNFKNGLVEYLAWTKITGRPVIKRLRNYINLINSSQEKFGCGGGIDRWTFTEKGKMECGILDLGKEPIPVPKKDEIEDLCSGCIIKDRCPKTCPIMLKQAFEDGLGQNNAQCQLHKIIILSLESAGLTDLTNE